jgi:hypothetical protein
MFTMILAAWIASGTQVIGIVTPGFSDPVTCNAAMASAVADFQGSPAGQQDLFYSFSVCVQNVQ